MKSAEEIMEILEGFDLTASYRDAAELAGCSPNTVANWVAQRDAGTLVPGRAARRPSVIDEFLPKIEELVERSEGKIRADVADHPPRGRGDQEGVAVGTGAGAPAVDPGARDVGAVRLR